MEVVSFLRENWQFISTGVVILFTFIFILLKKPYKVYGYYLDFVKWVKEAEKEYGSGHGQDKLQYVFNRYITKYKDTNYNFAKSHVAYIVDDILSTPQKKESSHEEIK